MTHQPGLVVMLGSGETSPSIRKVYDWLLQQQAVSPSVSVIETPAGFEPNSDRVAGKIARFFEHRLQNYRPKVEVIPARKRDTPFSPDNPDIVAPLLHSDVMFMGPGSPTYAVRQLQDTLAWHTIMARHRLGAALILASATTLAVSSHTVPVYEIYKVGEDLHWHLGLDFFGLYNLSLVFVPHWNNVEGGAELDTSRCYMGQQRFSELMSLLPPRQTVVGIDEHTALVFDLANEQCLVMGKGCVTVLTTGNTKEFAADESFPITELGPFKILAPETTIPANVWNTARQAHAQRQAAAAEVVAPPAEVVSLAEARQAARDSKDWAAADSLRDQISELGWAVKDTPDGPVLEYLES